MAIKIRTSTLADEPALDAIDVETWSPQVTPSPRPTPGEEFFGPGRGVEDALIAEVDGAVAGYVLIGREIPIDANAHVHKIHGLAVHPTFHRRGIARQLMTAAIAELTSRGANRIRSRVLATNPASIALHHALGFEIVGVLRGEFQIDGALVDDILWTLDVTPRPAIERPEPRLTYVELTEDRLDDLIDVMTSSRWTHFMRHEHTAESVRALWADGVFASEETVTYLVEELDSGRVIGMVQLNDLEDSTPIFDIRLREDMRGRGYGFEATHWLTHHLLFERGFGSVQANTRANNAPMRATLERVGYSKEGHYRAHSADHPENIGYRILRRDVDSGTRVPVRWFDL